MILATLLAVVIPLSGVTGKDLRARAFFDANNVKVGDPMTLTVDFLGEADFRSLHPPALAKCVSRKDWKLDDVSAKTETYRDARRLTYRVRPMREGVLWFPALEFGYAGEDGAARTVRANEIPVHAKAGAQVVVAEMSEETDKMPEAPFVTADVEDRRLVPELSDDERFAWRRACAMPTAEAFARFDFPAARLNEACCLVREGNWARALKVYQALEWSVGQTEEVERGLLAALAVRHDNPAVELPVWRQVGRPLLRFDWKGRLGLVGGGLAALVLVFWLLGRGIRAVACLAIVLSLAQPALAEDIFEQMERMHQRMMQRMSSGFGGFHFGEKEEREPVKILARLETSTNSFEVGMPFEYIVSLEAPRTSSIGQISMSPTERFGMTVTGEARNLEDGVSDNPTNVVKRLAVPVRYDVPYRGEISFVIEGMVSGRQRTRFGVMSFSNSFSCKTQPVAIDIRPLSGAGQPEDFAGVISEGLRVHELLDLLEVETNDVIQVTYRMFSKGFVPAGFLPKDAAFEMNRDERQGLIEYRRFFVADGRTETPKLSIPYYDPRTRTYRRAETGGTAIRYVTR